MSKILLIISLLLVAIYTASAFPRVHPLDGSGSGSGSGSSSSSSSSSSDDGPGGGCGDSDDDDDRQQSRQAGTNTISLGKKSGQIKVRAARWLCCALCHYPYDRGGRSTPPPTCPAMSASNFLSCKRCKQTAKSYRAWRTGCCLAVTRIEAVQAGRPSQVQSPTPAAPPSACELAQCFIVTI